MIPIEQALDLVLSTARSKERPDRMAAESVALPDTVGRILREEITCDADSPPFDKAVRDGFAVRSEDAREVPVALTVVGESRAGAVPSAEVGRGECCEIMTGAPLPAGADAVVMVERTYRLQDGRVEIRRSARENEGLLRRGAEARAGDVVLHAGSRIRPADIGVLAATGNSSVLVSSKPRVAVLATGDELVGVDAHPGPGQIRNSNSYALAALAADAGAAPVMLGIARDDVEDLRKKIGDGLRHDVLLVTGGVSMGKYDLVEGVFEEHGIEILFEQVAMKPGKPTVFGHRGPTFVFGLPGNPLSTMVAFHLFVRPLLQVLLKSSDIGTVMLSAQLEESMKCDPERVALLPAQVHFDRGAYHLLPVHWKGSSDLPSMARANAFVAVPQRQGFLSAGEVVEFMPLGGSYAG